MHSAVQKMDIIEPSKVALARNSVLPLGFNNNGVNIEVSEFRPNYNNGYNPRVSQHRPPVMFSGLGQQIGGNSMQNQGGFHIQLQVRRVPQAQIANSEDEEGPTIQTLDIRGLGKGNDSQPYQPVMVMPQAYNPFPNANGGQLNPNNMQNQNQNSGPLFQQIPNGQNNNNGKKNGNMPRF